MAITSVAYENSFSETHRGYRREHPLQNGERSLFDAWLFGRLLRRIPEHEIFNHLSDAQKLLLRKLLEEVASSATEEQQERFHLYLEKIEILMVMRQAETLKAACEEIMADLDARKDKAFDEERGWADL